MRAETLLPVEAQPSGEVVFMMGWPCGAGMAAEVGIFRSICARQRTTVVLDPQGLENIKCAGIITCVRVSVTQGIGTHGPTMNRHFKYMLKILCNVMNRVVSHL